ncbi:Fe-S cluster assembly protein SufD, partial [Pyxidicoccus sp. 3LG]
MTSALAHYLDVASRFHALQDASAPEWLKRVRAEGLAALEKQGLPTTRDEAWKYTNLAPLAEGTFIPAAESRGAGELAAVVEGLALPGPRLVFVDGRLAPELSSVAGL